MTAAWRAPRWREWAWQLYWALGEEYSDGNALEAHEPLPRWFADLDADGVEAASADSQVRKEDAD